MNEEAPKPIGQVECVCTCCRATKHVDVSERIEDGDYESLNGALVRDGQGWHVRWSEEDGEKIAQVYCPVCAKEVPEKPPVYGYGQSKKCPKCLSPKVATVWRGQRPYPDHPSLETIECLCAMCGFPYKATPADFRPSWWAKLKRRFLPRSARP